MPDIHWGYGFCIGGVCATDPLEGGVISPGGVGYDINCGVRLMTTSLSLGDVQPRLNALMDALFREIPAGVGKGGPYRFAAKELRRLMDRLPNLDQGARDEIRQSFDRLVNKLLHAPLESLRDESRQGVPHGLLDALARVFQLRD